MRLLGTEITLKTVIMEKTYNAQQAIIAQKEYLKELAKNNKNIIYRRLILVHAYSQTQEEVNLPSAVC